jgi:hypothetical protein
VALSNKYSLFFQLDQLDPKRIKLVKLEDSSKVIDLAGFQTGVPATRGRR